MADITANSILDRMYNWRIQKGDRVIVPNVYAPWECDLLAITRSGYAHEFEIKISKSDFKADFKKQKHEVFTGKLGRSKYVENPAYFWFVVPEGLVDISDVPDYCGLIEMVHKGTYPQVVRRAPQMHKNKASDKYKIMLLHSVCPRYWALRREIKLYKIKP